MSEFEIQIRKFYNDIGEYSQGIKYIHFPTFGKQSYILLSESRSVENFSTHVGKSGWFNNNMLQAVNGYEKFLAIVQYLPFVNTIHFNSSKRYCFEYGIVSDRNIVLISTSNDFVVKIGLENSSSVVNTIHNHKSIPSSINTASVLKTNYIIPYIMTEYIDGNIINNPVEKWPYVLNGLSQLKPLYDDTNTIWINTNKKLDDIYDKLKDSQSYDTLIPKFKNLSESDLPNKIAYGRTHGDFHGKNLLISGEKTYIIDWEEVRKEYIIRDFFNIFYHWCRYGSGSSNIFYDMYNKQGDGGEIAEQYAKKIGPIAWGSDKWFPNLLVIYAFSQYLFRSSDDPYKKFFLNLIKSL